MHLPGPVHRHPGPRDHPDRQGPGLTPLRPVARARNQTRGTEIAGRVEVAASLFGKFMGLMGRRALLHGDALWLPDSNGIHMMFMRFAIDAVFLGRPDSEGARMVVSVHRALPAWRGLIPLVRGGHGVLELPIGAIDASRTEPGDLVVLE